MLEQQAMIKVLLDENVKETSSLEESKFHSLINPIIILVTL